MAQLKTLPPLKLASRICETYVDDGFIGAVIRGVQRVGKTSYTTQAMAQALGKWEWSSDPPIVKPDFEAVKPWTVFMPKEFLDVILDTSGKQKGLIWDDAGYWLFALDWYDPFVKSVSKYMQVAGTQFAFLGLTTPAVNLISSKVLDSLPDHYMITVTNDSSKRQTSRHKPKIAKSYQKWTYPDGSKGGVHTRWHDFFDAMLPDKFFKWYKPKRDSYLTVAKTIMRREVRKVTKQMDKKEEAEFMEDVHKVVGSPERVAELNEVIASIDTK